MSVYCRTGATEWRRVLRHGVNGLEVEKQTMSFQEAWQDPPEAESHSEAETMPACWEDLLVPLPELPGPARAYALTYPEHQKEARVSDVFSFEKRGVAQSASLSIQHRPALDYEAEVALLLQRDEPQRFGYLFANDLTDRAAQIRTFHRLNPAPGFSEAKSFPDALRVGPLLAIGGDELWPDLAVSLELNGQRRQRVTTRECLLTPREFHQQTFARDDAIDWMLVLTGTTSGTIFQSPTPVQKLKLLLRSGFSARRAQAAWLGEFQFLQVGDRVEMTSEMLGRSCATVVAQSE